MKSHTYGKKLLYKSLILPFIFSVIKVHKNVYVEILLFLEEEFAFILY